MTCAKVSELKVLNESLHKENIVKQREIRQLNKDAQCYEQTIMNLRKEMSNCKYHTPEVSTKDAEVMAGMCCTGNECGEWEPVKDFSEMLRDETLKYQERVHKMEANLKSSGDNIRALRKVNVSLTEEMHSMRRVCAALDEQCRAANMRAQFKDDIIKEMRRQLKQAKAKSFTSCIAKTSTPNTSIVPLVTSATSMPNVSGIERSTSVPTLVSDASIADLRIHINGCCPSKNDEFQVNNTTHFIAPPNGTPRSWPKETPSTSSSKGKQAFRIGLPEESGSLKDDVITHLRKEETEEMTSLNNFLREKSAITSLPKDSPEICFSKQSSRSSKDFHKSCIAREQCKRCSKAKKAMCECGCVKSVGFVPSDEALETADKRTCVEDLYFNDEAIKSGCLTPRGHSCKEKSAHFLEDSGATSSLMDSTSATCDASATYYHNKLLATLQILQNKEETISVQADSLAVAEERIATLNDRANDLKRELDRKAKEYSTLRKSIECCKPVLVDACHVTDRPMEDQTDIVNTLENNLCVIEDLYRECFYETAKQENLIEMLRSSYLDVRVMDRQKADQIGRLQTVISTQKWSLDRCQDIALEVDGLKMEISNFLSSSGSTNNDSGMWERSEESYAPAPGVQDDLHDVREQLLTLQDLLAFDSCTCGLHEENIKFKKKAESLEITVAELQDKLCGVEHSLSSKWNTDSKWQEEIESKEQELAHMREQLIHSQNCARDQSCTVESISTQLGQTKALLYEKTTEVSQLRQENETHSNTIKELQEELAKADHIINENCKMRSEVAYLSTQVQLWRAQLDDSKRRVRALEAELARTRAHAAHIDTCYREKAGNVAELQAHLEQAHERGAALCGEARGAVCAVRGWMRRMRDKHREKDNVLKEKDSIIANLRRRLEERQNDSQCTSTSENTASCSKCQSSRDERRFCSKRGIRRGQSHVPSTSEMPSCSSTPTPIRLRKKQSGNNVWLCDAGAERVDAACGARRACCGRDVRHVTLTLERTPRDVSPTEALLRRVEQLTQALADGSRRWTRPRDAR